MTYVPYKKGTLWIPSGPNDTKHLFVIVTDKCEAGLHLIVNFTSIRGGVPYDPACVLAAGDHPAIKQPSYVYYAMADTQPADRLTKFVDLKYYQCGDDISDDLLARIVQGAEESDFVKKRIARYLG